MDNESLKLNFSGYDILKSNLSKVKLSDELAEESDIGFLVKVTPNKNKSFDKVNIIFGIQINPSEDFPYNIETIMKGNFEISNCENDEERMDFAIVNCSAILFPYIRSFISALTSQLECEKLILPVMNIYELIKDIPQIDLVNDESQFEEF